MSIYSSLIPIISKISPVLGSALGGPAGALVGSLISSTLGVDMSKPEDLISKLTEPSSVDKLKDLELQLKDLQDARSQASKDVGALRFVRPILAGLAMVAIFADVLLINYVEDYVVNQILVVMLVSLVWDVRQIYKFYFGSGEEVPSFLLKDKR
jgi:hypothetical protein